MTTKATNWVWEKVEKIDDKVGDFQLDVAEWTSKPFPKAYKLSARPTVKAHDKIGDANHAARDGIRTVREKLPHPITHARGVYKRASRAKRFLGLGECAVMAGTRLVGNVACFTAHTARVGLKVGSYGLTTVPVAVAWIGLSVAWVASVAVPFTAIGLVGRAPLYLGGAVSTLVLEAPGVIRRAAGLPVRFVRAAVDMVWNGDREAQANIKPRERESAPRDVTTDLSGRRQPDVERRELDVDKTKGKAELRKTGTPSKESLKGHQLRGFTSRMRRNSGPQGPDKGGLS